MSTCQAACESMGDVGGIVFSLLALGWGIYQRRQMHVERREKEVYRALSLRPPPGPVDPPVKP